MDERPRPPPVAASPKPKFDAALDEATPAGRGDGVSGTSPGVTLAQLKQESRQRRKRRPWYVGLATAVTGAAVTAGVSTYRQSDDAHETAQTVSARLDERLKTEKEARQQLEHKVEGVKTQVNHLDIKLDLLLDDRRVPAWKRPPPLDGGDR